MKIAYVTPRYGSEVRAGAEHGARRLAEELVARTGWTVEVLTSCATDATTWASEYPEGTSVLHGVTVQRFTTSRRAADFDVLSNAFFGDLRNRSLADEAAWVAAQGPVSAAWIEAITQCDADLVIFYPYLYYPTIVGLERVARRAVLHPAAHNEAPLRLKTLQSVVPAAQGLVFQTESERRLVEHLFPVAHRPQVVLGLGADPVEADERQAREVLGIGAAPYLLYVGRVDDGKGTGRLAEWFARYRAERPTCELQLVIAGPIVHEPPADSNVHVTGSVDDVTKWGLLRGAAAFVNPSPLEAFSIVLIEAWEAGTSVLVNRECAATNEHVRRSGGGVAYGSYEEFVAAVDALVADPSLGIERAKAGKRYVDDWFTWPSIAARYATFLTRVAERTTR